MICEIRFHHVLSILEISYDWNLQKFHGWKPLGSFYLGRDDTVGGSEISNNHLGCVPNPVNNGINYLSLSWISQISSINSTICVEVEHINTDSKQGNLRLKEPSECLTPGGSCDGRVFKKCIINIYNWANYSDVSRGDEVGILELAR